MKKSNSDYSSSFTNAHAQSYGYVLKQPKFNPDNIDWAEELAKAMSKPLALTVSNLGTILSSRYIHRYGSEKAAPNVPFFRSGSIAAKDGYHFFCALDDAISDGVLTASEALDFILDFEKNYSGFYTSGATEFKEHVLNLYQKEVNRASE